MDVYIVISVLKVKKESRIFSIDGLVLSETTELSNTSLSKRFKMTQNIQYLCCHTEWNYAFLNLTNA